MVAFRGGGPGGGAGGGTFIRITSDALRGFCTFGRGPIWAPGPLDTGAPRPPAGGWPDGYNFLPPPATCGVPPVGVMDAAVRMGWTLEPAGTEFGAAGRFAPPSGTKDVCKGVRVAANAARFPPFFTSVPAAADGCGRTAVAVGLPLRGGTAGSFMLAATAEAKAATVGLGVVFGVVLAEWKGVPGDAGGDMPRGMAAGTVSVSMERRCAPALEGVGGMPGMVAACTCPSATTALAPPRRFFLRLDLSDFSPVAISFDASPAAFARTGDAGGFPVAAGAAFPPSFGPVDTAAGVLVV